MARLRALPRRASSGGVAVFAIAALVISAAIAHASSNNHNIVTIRTDPDNIFDNRLTTLTSDSGTAIQIAVDGTAAGDDADREGGVRIEIYNSGGTLVRRRISTEIDSQTPAVSPRKYSFQWNGRGDSTTVNDTLPYGSYTVRAYASMRDPTVSATIQGAGIVIDRPGDLHVTDTGVLTWTNTGGRLSFCQVTLGDPQVAAPTLLRLVDIPAEIQGTQNEDGNFGVTVNSQGDIFVSYDTSAGAGIAKYSTTTETWTNLKWATGATTSGADDQWMGLGIDSMDSIYLAQSRTLTTLSGGYGGNPVPEGVVKFKDNGTTATEDTFTADQNTDYYDVAAFTQTRTVPAITGDSGQGRYIYAVEYEGGQVDSFGINPRERDPILTFDNTSRGKGIWALPDSTFYITNDVRDSFGKFRHTGAAIYSYSGGEIDGATGIAVWRRSATETYVIVSAQTSNAIVVYKENASGTAVTLVRTIEDDVNNLVTPIGIAVDADSAVFVVSRGARTVKKFNKDGVFQNMAGAANGKYISGTDNTTTLTDTQGFNTPGAIAVDTAGYIYVFDEEAGFGGDKAIKRFSPDGTPDSVIWYDIDASTPGLVHGNEITMATFAAGNLYFVARENDARLVRVSIANDADSKYMNNGSTPAQGTDVLSLYAGPVFDAATPRFFPTAIHCYQSDDRITVYTTDLNTQIIAASTPDAPVVPTALNATQPFLVDNFGDVYVMIDDGLGTYQFRRYNAASPDSGYMLQGLLDYDFTQGAGNSQFNAPTQMVWVDGKGIFNFNGATGRYEQKIWLNDSVNNRLKQLTVDWNDVVETPVLITPVDDTPIVISASITGDTVITISGTTYVGVCTPTIQLNFNNTMGGETDVTPAVTVVFSDATSATANKVSYSATTYSCTVVLTTANPEGTTDIQAEDFVDAAGVANPPARLLSPNPDITSQDGSDDFIPFVIDYSGPVFSVTTPPSGGASTNVATYTVAGTVTTEATGKDATILVENYTDSLAGTVFDSFTTPATGAGAFSGIIDLKPPSPSNNYIQVTAIDKLGYRSNLGNRRVVEYAPNYGSAEITPYSSIQVDSLRAYQFIYTSAQALTANDSVRFTIPAGWSAPQKTTTSSNGYIRVISPGAYTDSVVDGAARTVTIVGPVMSQGATLILNYGDANADSGGRAKPEADEPLDAASNTFTCAMHFQGDTQFTNVPAGSGKTLTVTVVDSSPFAAMLETGAKTTVRVDASKGGETKVLTLRVHNLNVGDHTHKISQIILRADSGAGQALNWNAVASRVRVRNVAEDVVFADVTTLPGSQDLTIPLTNFTVAHATPFVRDMEVWVTISSNATTDSARFYFNSASVFTVTDSVSGNTLSMLEQETGFIQKIAGPYDIYGLAPADTMSLGADTSGATTSAATGQKAISVMKLLFKNDAANEATAVNNAKVEKVVLSTRDNAGSTISCASVLAAAYLRDDVTSTLYGSVSSFSASGDTFTINLTNANIASGDSIRMALTVDVIADTTSNSRFRVGLMDTGSVTVKDAVTSLSMARRDDPVRSEVITFLSDTVTLIPKSKANLRRVTIVRADSTDILGELLASQLVRGDLFFVGVNYVDSAGSSNLRVIPTDTDLKFWIDGSDKTSEFTVTAEASRQVTAGNQDTFYYRCIQDLGTTTGELRVLLGDTTVDTRPRCFDNLDYFEPDKLRANLALPGVMNQFDSVQITSATFSVSASSIDTSYANASETAVRILQFAVTKNVAGQRFLDTVVVEGLSAGASVTQVRIYHDDRDGVLEPHWAAAARDSQVGKGTLGASTDSVMIDFDTPVSLGAISDSALFFVTFDFSSSVTDGDTFDARVPVRGILSTTGADDPFPSASVVASSGEGRVEVVAVICSMTPDSQIVAVGSSPNFTLKAVDARGNIDAVSNAESGGPTQAHNVQVTVTIGTTDADASAYISNTSGMTSVAPAAGPGVTSLSGKLSSGQGTVTAFNNEGETVSVTLASILTDSTGQIQFAALTTAAAVALASADSGAPDSKAYPVAIFRVTNSSGASDSIGHVRLKSLNIHDTNLVDTSVTLWRDKNSNNLIDSGTDTLLGTGGWDQGYLSFTGLSDTLQNGETGTYMIGYNIKTVVVQDGDLLDCQVDSVINKLDNNIVTTALNSTPNRYLDVRASKITLSPTTGGPIGTGNTLQTTATAVDTYGNRDRHYTGGTPTKVEFDLSLSAQFTTSTMNGQEHPVGADATKIRGYLPSGQAVLTFLDNTAEVSVLTPSVTPNLTATSDTGSFTWSQGYTAGDSTLGFATVSPSDTNRIIQAFSVSATGTTDSVTEVGIHWTGTATDRVSNLRLFRSTNAIFDSATDPLYGTYPVSFSGESVTFNNDTAEIQNGQTRYFFFVVDIGSNVANGDTFNSEIFAGAIKTQGGLTGIPASVLNSTGHETAVVSTTWTVTALASSDTVMVQNDSNQVIGRFLFRNTGGARDTIQEIVVHNRGKVLTGDINRVELFLDANGNYTFDTGVDTRYATPKTFVSTETALFNDSFGINGGDSRLLFVVYAIDTPTTAIDGDTADCEIQAGRARTVLAGTIPAVTVNSSDSCRLTFPSSGAWTGDSYTLSDSEIAPGYANVILGHFSISNTFGSSKILDTVVVTLDGHPDTGLTAVRLFLDGNDNGTFEVAVDTQFGSTGVFAARQITFDGAATLNATNDTFGLLVIANLSDTITVDSQILRVRIDTGGVKATSTETAALKVLQSPGVRKTRVTLVNGDSVLVAAGAGVVNETVAVSATVRDTKGVIAVGRSVRLYEYGSASIVGANTATTDSTGVVRFILTSASAGAFSCTVAIDTTTKPAAAGFANFLSIQSMRDTQFTNNTQRGTMNSGFAAGKLFVSPPSFSHTAANRMADLVFDSTYSIRRYALPAAPTVFWTERNVGEMSESRVFPAHTSMAKVRNLKGVGDAIVFGAYASQTNYGINLYYKPWGAAASDSPLRLSPNDTRTGSLNRRFDTDAMFDQFDVHPSGDSVIFCADGNLGVFMAKGATFTPVMDSGTIQYYIFWQPASGYTIGGRYAAYPSYSPDGNRVALTIIDRDPDWDGVGSVSNSAQIYVMRNLSSFGPLAQFPPSNLFNCIQGLSDTRLIKITDTNVLRFAWMPQWSKDGSVLFFSANNSPDFDYDLFSQYEVPASAINATNVNFDGYMMYYDAVNETSPYAPIRITNETGTVSELLGEMDSGGAAFLGYTRTTSANFYEARTLTIADEATVNSSGGVLFDSGRVAVVVAPSDTYGTGFVISIRTPDSAPSGSDSVILSGLAKKYFRPDTPTEKVYFADSVVVFFYYDKTDFADTELQGYDGDGDGIPDRTEAAATAYFWNGSSWIEYPTVRVPEENKIIFFTDHFSLYGMGLAAEVRALAFGGVVNEIVAYPNPWRIDGPTSGLSPSDPAYGVKFTNFPGGDVRVRIYTIAGERVLDETVNGLNNTTTSSHLRITAILNNVTRGTVSWDLRNRAGREVGSGIYLVMFDGPGGRAVRKVAVIR